MTLPQEILQKTEELLCNVPLSTLKTAAEELSSTYRNSARTGGELLNNKSAILAYIASRMPATYAAVDSAIKSAKDELEKLNIKTVLDVGAGPGTASIAVASNFENPKITLVERNCDMIEVGRLLLSEMSCESEWVNTDISEIDLSADLVVSAYMFNEMPKNAVINTVCKLYNSAKKTLIIVDNGTPNTFSLMKTVRETLLSRGGNIVAPCANSNDCQNEWCHFSARVGRTKLHKLLKGGDAPYEDEKFCYLVVTKTPTENAERVLRHPQISKGRVELILCTKNGITQKTITKTQKELFKKARKLNWGDTL